MQLEDVWLSLLEKSLKMFDLCPLKRSVNHKKKKKINTETKNFLMTTNQIRNSLSPGRRYSSALWLRSWRRWRATSSVPTSSRWWPWGSVWGAVTGGAGWAGGARRRTGRCHRSARGWWHADALPATGCRHHRSPKIPLGPKQRWVKTFKGFGLI